MSEELIKNLISVVKTNNWVFSFQNRILSLQEIFSDTGLLPALAKRADQLCSLCLGYGIGVTFQDFDKALLGIKVQFDDITPNVLRLLCIYDVISELARNSPGAGKVVLDELMYD
jgi:intracellular multiplication protein IcmS